MFLRTIAHNVTEIGEIKIGNLKISFAVHFTPIPPQTSRVDELSTFRGNFCFNRIKQNVSLNGHTENPRKSQAGSRSGTRGQSQLFGWVTF